MNIDLTIPSGAIFSEDRLYRYALWRVWKCNPTMVLIIGLNPSTATEIINDPTITRCIKFAYSWGYGGLFMGNIFASRSTDPRKLLEVIDPIGPKNDATLLEMHQLSKQTVFCWGNWGYLLDRGQKVAGLLRGGFCFGITKLGYPKHPLYLSHETSLVPFVK